MKKGQLLKVVFFGVLGVVASACGRAPKLAVDPQLTGYVSEFEQVSVEQGSPVKITDLIVGFGSLEDPRTNGVCEIRDGETPKITISKTKWATMDAEKRESLLFHELGHCVLGRKHDSAVSNQGIPLSVMNPYSLDSETYSENHDYYVHELFHGHQQES